MCGVKRFNDLWNLKPHDKRHPEKRFLIATIFLTFLALYFDQNYYGEFKFPKKQL